MPVGMGFTALTDETHSPEPLPQSPQDDEETPDQVAEETRLPGAENSPEPPAKTEQDPPFQQFILSMKQQVRAAEEDPDSPMRTLESVQDQLIDQLDHLNRRIENYIDLLAAQRKSA